MDYMVELRYNVHLTQAELTWWRLLRMGPLGGHRTVDSVLREELRFSRYPWEYLWVANYGGSYWEVRIKYAENAPPIKDYVYQYFLRVCRDK